jgi:hypothetical protein
MYNINEPGNRSEDFIVFVDNQIHARDREYGRRRTSVFLINERTGAVYRRNGEQLEEVSEDFRSDIINNICTARDNRIPPESLFE